MILEKPVAIPGFMNITCTRLNTSVSLEREKSHVMASVWRWCHHYLHVLKSLFVLIFTTVVPVQWVILPSLECGVTVCAWLHSLSVDKAPPSLSHSEQTQLLRQSPILQHSRASLSSCDASQPPSALLSTGSTGKPLCCYIYLRHERKCSE